ncbi:ABC transporter substrate-binding protein [Paenibacillus crassostreae]|uniref:ABC transporter substrate-binding protein n=1 Tax=Paenibacillus crassostreae TaxID=1763538 RepID=A0A167GRM8_9BACL|nr:extracellular solute-binding protein [Paenibacillus crassostreae]AOZ92029.1 ABC transporter substrate-binding protein [Paenibacillus crassostreae]OAB77838.1 ABC transporter substrate-binding protein [Paenibacillus crassostreae]
MKQMKLFSMLLVCFVLLISACSGGNNVQTNESVTKTEAVTPTEEVKTEPEPQPEEVVDLGGRVIKMSAWWDLTPAGTTASDKARLAKIAELEKKYNMKIEFVNVPFGEYMDKFTTTVLAGEPFADIVLLEYKSALPAALKGQLLELSEFTKPESNINNEMNLVVKSASLAGKEYAFDNPTTLAVGVHYNRDIFKKLGLPDLQELYSKGEWNWEKFIEVAKLATKDTDNNGKIDTYGFSGWAAQVGRILVAANGAKVADDSTSKEGLSDPRTIEAMEFLNHIYNVENVAKIKTGDKVNWEETDTFKDGDVAMFIASEWQMPDLTFDVGIVPIPNGPQGTAEVTYANTAAASRFIPKGVKDPEIVYQIFEEMQDVPQLEEYPGQDYLESLYGHEEDIQMIRDHIYGTGIIVLDEAYPEYPFNSFVEDVIKNNASVTATAEKYKQQAQASIDKLGK